LRISEIFGIIQNRTKTLDVSNFEVQQQQHQQQKQEQQSLFTLVGYKR